MTVESNRQALRDLSYGWYVVASRGEVRSMGTTTSPVNRCGVGIG